mmetsp:Transcript_61140/g.171044  ORF Transcript_61140/g.171044 Transcript_61140/m.171044 type:complete len:231 (+) Transcript_61140:111-803(+)
MAPHLQLTLVVVMLGASLVTTSATYASPAATEAEAPEPSTAMKRSFYVADSFAIAKPERAAAFGGGMADGVATPRKAAVMRRHRSKRNIAASLMDVNEADATHEQRVAAQMGPGALRDQPAATWHQSPRRLVEISAKNAVEEPSFGRGTHVADAITIDSTAVVQKPMALHQQGAAATATEEPRASEAAMAPPSRSVMRRDSNRPSVMRRHKDSSPSTSVVVEGSLDLGVM